MTKQMLLYGEATPLNADLHRDLSIRQTGNYQFAQKLGAVPLVVAEFAAAARDMPIVFARTEEGTFPWAMMGLDAAHNMFVSPDGSWSGGYIPAFLRRYPFVFASAPGSEQLALCIDEQHDALNREGIGERLFDATGNRTQYLAGMLDFATEYQRQFLRTKQFVERLETLELLEPIAATYTDRENRLRRVAGVSRIKRDMLKAIPQETLVEMFASDELELCFLHLQSLSNIARLSPTAAPRAEQALDLERDAKMQTPESEPA
jgi:hypothetical protein